MSMNLNDVAGITCGPAVPDDNFTEFSLRLLTLEAKVMALKEGTASTAEVICRLIEADPHQWSTRPCQTCISVSALLGRPFGCSAEAKRR